MRFERIVARYMAKQHLKAQGGRGRVAREYAFKMGFNAGVQYAHQYEQQKLGQKEAET